MKSPRGISFYQEQKRINNDNNNNNNNNENSPEGEEAHNLEMSPQNISQDTDTLMRVFTKKKTIITRE